MKKQVLFAALAVLLAFAFISCGDDTVSLATIGSVGDVGYNQHDDRTVRLTWDAVRDAYSYTVYLRKDGTNTIIEISSALNTVNASVGVVTSNWSQAGEGLPLDVNNINVDKWEATFQLLFGGGNYNIGVQADSPNPNTQPSGIKWIGVKPITALP